MPAKVDLAYFSFTEITDPAEHASYNQWHLFDHMPENLALPGIAWAQRWVASPELPAFAVDDALAPVHYVTVYLMTEPTERTLAEFFALGERLRSLGRFHQHRRALLGGPFRLVKCYASPRALVSADSVPYRPHRGVLVTVAEVVERGRSEEVARWLDDVHVPDLLTVPGVAGVWTFQAMPKAATMLTANPPTRSIQLCWLDDDPAVVARAIAEKTNDTPFPDTAWHVLYRRAVAPIDPHGPFDWFAPEWARG
jgi:hypothetical protein